MGGLTYGLTDKFALEYMYHGLKSKNGDNTVAANSDEHKINLLYSINKNFDGYVGWNRINNSGDAGASQVSNIAQLGLIAKVPLGKEANLYARGSVGTHSPYVWELGASTCITKNADLAIGWRQVKNTDDSGNAAVGDVCSKYKGLFASVNFRFGGSK